MSITDKQKAFIETICNQLDIEFKGTTKQEATKFISDNIREFEDEQAKDNALWSIEVENAGDR